MLYSWDICDQYMKVLLIEDELKTGQSIKSYLQEECKYEVIWHNDGLAGLKTAKENLESRRQFSFYQRYINLRIKYRD